MEGERRRIDGHNSMRQGTSLRAVSGGSRGRHAGPQCIRGAARWPHSLPTPSVAPRHEPFQLRSLADRVELSGLERGEARDPEHLADSTRVDVAVWIEPEQRRAQPRDVGRGDVGAATIAARLKTARLSTPPSRKLAARRADFVPTRQTRSGHLADRSPLRRRPLYRPRA